MMRGSVKFFNAAKGFGFIAPDNGEPDIFVHVSALQQAGLNGLEEGDQVAFALERDRRSGKPNAVDLQWLGKGEAPARPRAAPSRSFDRRPAREPAGSGEGVVKWFNAAKGFGFITPTDGGADVFVHASAVERAGVGALREGQAVAFDLEADRRTGKASAANLRLM